MHRIHPRGVVFPFSFAFSLLISSIMMISSSEVIMMVSSAGLSSSPIKPNSSSWVWGGWQGPFHRYCESTVHPWVWLWHALHAWCRGWAAPSFLLCFLFVSLLQTLCQNWHITSSLHFLLLSSAPWILWQNWHIITASSFLLSHHLLPLVDTLSLHLYFIIFYIP